MYFKRHLSFSIRSILRSNRASFLKTCFLLKYLIQMNYKFITPLASFIFIAHFISYSQNIEGLRSQDPFTLSGSLGASSVFYNIKGRETARPGFSWMFVGNPVVSIYGITLPFSMTISDQNSHIRQPFNKIGVSPYYKWAKLHLGYRNPVFSQYTLGGHTIYGAGGEFSPGKFKIGLMHGRLYKQINSDPLLLSDPDKFRLPFYKRNGTGFLMAYNNSVTKINFSFFHGLDIASSVNAQTQELIKPAENIVFNFNINQRLSKNLEFGFEYANSAYTENTLSDSINRKFNKFSNIIKTNYTTAESQVYDSHLAYIAESFSLKLRVKQIDPGFQSMGTYYIQNDFRNITIEPFYSFKQKRYSINGSFGFQQDNIKKTNKYQTQRRIGSLGFSAMPWKWSKTDINLSNYNTNMRRGLSEIDSLMKISQTTRSFNITQNFNFINESFAHNVLIIYNNQKLKDNNAGSALYNNYVSNMLSGSYLINYLPKLMNMGLSYNLSKFDFTNNKTKVAGPVISFSTSIFQNKLNLSLSNSFYSTTTNDIKSNRLNIFSLSNSYRVDKRHRFRLSYFNQKSKSLNASSTDFSENKGELGYSFTF